MIVLEFKAKGKITQYDAIDEAIKTSQFVRNKIIRYWMDNRGVGQKELYRHNTALRAEFPFVKALNSHACQVAVDRAYIAINRFYANCKKGVPGKKGYPKFKKNSRSVEYKTSGWKLSSDRRSINFIDKKGIGKLKLKGTWDLHYYQLDQIKRVRLVRRESWLLCPVLGECREQGRRRFNRQKYWIRRRTSYVLHRFQWSH